jgi:NADH-quinone oxidoreductase subunit J
MLKVAGIAVGGKGKGEGIEEEKPVDVKSAVIFAQKTVEFFVFLRLHGKNKFMEISLHSSRIGFTAMVITIKNAVHALLYLIVSLLAVALVFFSLGAPFAAALEIIIYAGAIMVLFVFVIMMLNLGASVTKQESQWLTPRIWTGPSILALVLMAELVYVLATGRSTAPAAVLVGPKQVGITLLGPYVLGGTAHAAARGLIGAYHVGRPHKH